MRSGSRLGAVNLALISIYFVPIWGADALHMLISPYHGFDDRVHAATATYFCRLFDLPMEGLVHVSNVLGGIELVIAVGFVACFIEFMRSIAMAREVDPATADVVLLLALGAIVMRMLPGMALGDPDMVRLNATQLLLVTGAMVVLVIERHLQERLTERLPSLPRIPTLALVWNQLPLGLRRDLPGPSFYRPTR
jgi:hypothetical protein